MQQAREQADKQKIAAPMLNLAIATGATQKATANPTTQFVVLPIVWQGGIDPDNVAAANVVVEGTSLPTNLSYSQYITPDVNYNQHDDQLAVVQALQELSFENPNILAMRVGSLNTQNHIQLAALGEATFPTVGFHKPRDVNVNATTTYWQDIAATENFKTTLLYQDGDGWANAYSQAPAAIAEIIGDRLTAINRVATGLQNTGNSGL